ncbi:MAG: 30S ribosomal protein S11 [Candidatus Yanofskybacteria bacterium]|nr:30S ribosomal protein S11 [Candidatus Yanofskybacteria bacterium]
MNETEGVQKTPIEIAKKSSTPSLPARAGSKRQVINGMAHITVSYNNTIIAITDTKGEVLAWSSAGSLGFKGAKKSTPYAANLVAKNVIEKARKYNLVNLKINVRGVGPGRESAIRGLAAGGLNITALVDKTPIAHNGVKSPKPRRV